MKRIRVYHLASALSFIAACSGSKDLTEGPPISGGGDGGPAGRIVIDAGPDSPSGTSPDAPVTQLPDGVSVTITLVNVAEGAIVKSSDTSFKPTMRVETTALDLSDLPSIRAAYIEVHVGGNAMPVRVNLEELSAPVIATDPSASGVYTFGNILVSLAGLQSGQVNLRAVVETASNAVVDKTVTIKVDAGPAITFLKPDDEQPFKGNAGVEVRISDAEFMPIKDVSFLLGSNEIAFEMVQDGSGLYRASIDFSKFTPPLTGEQLITVRAKNSNNTQSVGSRKFVADNVGPSFESMTPAEGQMIGGIITVSAVVKDPAGVAPDSVVAVIGNNATDIVEIRLNPPPVGSTEARYSKLFDTKQLPKNAIRPSVSFRAADKLGNENSTGFLVDLDTNPPLADLDPPDDFRYLVEFNNVLRCTWPFDPVGPDAVDDGQLVNQAFDVRVRVEDQGNQVVSGNIDFVKIAGIKKVDLLVLDDTSRALVVDTDDDDKCDALNPLLVPTSQPAGGNGILLLGLQALQPQGTPDNYPEVPLPGICETGGLSEPVKPLCDGIGPTMNFSKARYATSSALPHSHFMSVFVQYAQDRLPAIWTPGPIAAGVECAGRQIETLGNNIKDGWACLAALAEDKLGQKQVSRPIRVCIDHDQKDNECPHRKVVRVSSTTPVEVETATAHMLATGDEVFLQGVLCQTQANGKRRITVTGSTTFTLNNVPGRPDLDARLGCSQGAENAWVVGTKEMPDCTGKQTQKDPSPVVDDQATCGPWREFPSQEIRYRR